MSFWDSITGEVTEQQTRTGFEVIPNDTKALAMLEDTVLMTFEDNENFKITWRLMNGDFKNRIVWQNLYVFDEDEKKAAKQRNMLAKIFEITGITRPADRPTTNDLLRMKGKIVGIKIQEYPRIDKKTGEFRNSNWISNVYVPNSDFVECTGTAMDTSEKNMAPVKKAAVIKDVKPEFNDDIPF